MHVHGNQFDPNFEMNMLYSAAEAAKEAERTRRKLMNAASALAGEYDDADDCIVRLSGDSGSEEQANRQDGSEQGSRKKQNEQAEAESFNSAFSDWV